MKSLFSTTPHKALLGGSLASSLSPAPATPLILTLIHLTFFSFWLDRFEALFHVTHLRSLFVLMDTLPSEVHLTHLPFLSPKMPSYCCQYPFLAELSSTLPPHP